MHQVNNILFRLATLLVVIAAAGWTAINTQGRSSNAQSADRIRLTAVIVKQGFCSGDKDTYTFTFDLNTNYENMGNKPLTVFTGTDVPTEILIADSLEHLDRSKVEAKLDLETYPMNGGQYMLGSDPGKEKRVILNPKESTAGHTSIAVVVRRIQSAKIPGTIGKGVHYMTVTMRLKISNASSSKKIEMYKWVAIQSEPIKFDVPVNPVVKTCAD